jgi:multiple sugar transport system substrate-binding protein
VAVFRKLFARLTPKPPHLLSSFGGKTSFFDRATPAIAPGIVRIAGVTFSDLGRRALSALSEDFERHYPGQEVLLLKLGEETYKAQEFEWLKQGEFDIFLGFGGLTMRRLVQEGLIAPLTSLWRSEGLDHAFNSPARAAVSVGGTPYGIPMTYYSWSFYYRKSLFRQLGLTPPTNWPQFLSLLERLAAVKITPLGISGRELWPLAAYFEYLDLRHNGLEFHNLLLRGHNNFDDPRLVPVFNSWAQLRPYMTPNFTDYSWEHLAVELSQYRIGMCLLGAFLLPLLPAAVRADIDSFRFPLLNDDIPLAELAPIDMAVLASNAQNPKGGELFLRHCTKPSLQRALNEPMRTLSPHIKAPPSDDPLIVRQAEILSAAKEFALYFDRELPPFLAQHSLEIFAQFLKDGDISQTLERLKTLYRQHHSLLE